MKEELIAGMLYFGICSVTLGLAFWSAGAFQ
jgi:hypothetical protein